MENKKLSEEEINNLEKELTDLHDSIIKDLGEKDVLYIRNMIKLVKYTNLAGRLLLHFGKDPVTFMLGSFSLSVSKILENLEVGHNLMHGQYDWTNDPELSGKVYEWDNFCSPEKWKKHHNHDHHLYTNIVGKDEDSGSIFFRMTKKQKWQKSHFFQLFGFIVSLPFFELLIAVIHNRNKISHDFLKHISLKILKDYIFFPLLATKNSKRVLLGNYISNTIRNIWLYFMILSGHLPEGLEHYLEEDCINESKGQWYLRQARSTTNINGNKLFYILSGHASHQVEHHLFPDIPAIRLSDMSPQVKQILEKYGQNYNTGNFFTQFATVLKNAVKYSLP